MYAIHNLLILSSNYYAYKTDSSNCNYCYTLIDWFPSDDKCHEVEECNTVVSLSQCLSSFSNNFNTDISSSSSEFCESQPLRTM